MRIDVFLIVLFLLDDRRIRIRISDKWIRIREAQKHMDPPPMDPDPQHWLQLFNYHKIKFKTTWA